MPNYPERKRLRLENFDYSQNNAYFVTICTDKRQHLFDEIALDSVGADPCVRPSDVNNMLMKWLNKIEEKFSDYILDMYAIMPDHIHFIVIKCGTVGGHMGPPLQDVIQWFKTQTTNEYIQGVKTGIYKPFNKKIWQRSYYDHIIRNKQDLQETRKYIYENPVKWYAEHCDDVF